MQCNWQCNILCNFRNFRKYLLRCFIETWKKWHCGYKGLLHDILFCSFPFRSFPLCSMAFCLFIRHSAALLRSGYHQYTASFISFKTLQDQLDLQDSVLVQTLLAVCGRFSMMGFSENDPDSEIRSFKSNSASLIIVSLQSCHCQFWFVLMSV